MTKYKRKKCKKYAKKFTPNTAQLELMRHDYKIAKMVPNIYSRPLKLNPIVSTLVNFTFSEKIMLDKRAKFKVK